MGFIQHDDGIRAAEGIDPTLPLQHTVHHVFDPRLETGTIFEPDGVPTSWPRRQPTSSATCFATDMAATRRGWVQPIRPRSA